jgi:hypothetical protein
MVPVAKPERPGPEVRTVRHDEMVELDACGRQCPGPITAV